MSSTASCTEVTADSPENMSRLRRSRSSSTDGAWILGTQRSSSTNNPSRSQPPPNPITDSPLITGTPSTQRPPNTRRPPNNQRSQNARERPDTPREIWQPTPPIGPAPEYAELELPIPSPPDITEDTISPHYQFDAPPVPLLFQAILDDDEENLIRLLTQNPVLVNEKDPTGRTPLYLAVIAYDGRIGIVKLLLEAGAEVDGWSTEIVSAKNWYSAPEQNSQRTPLMAASARNRLPIARLLLSPPYNANSALIAPDGQHALRLASTSQAREIVALLPSLRAGGWKRMKSRSQPHIVVIKKTGILMYEVGRIFVWDVPKFFVWTAPKYMGMCIWEVLKDMGKDALKFTQFIWEEMKKLPGATKRLCMWLPGAVWGRIRRSPGALKRLAAKVWAGIKDLAKWLWDVITVKLPKVTVAVANFLVKMVKWTWKFLTVHIPKFTVAVTKFFWRVITSIAKWVWDIVTVRVPKVSVMVYHAIIEALGTSWGWFVNMLGALASLVHTFVSFILRQCTLANVVQAIKQTLAFFFVSVPKAIWTAIKGTYKLCFEIFRGLFGCIGWFFWKLAECLVASILWFPAMMGKILVHCGMILKGVWKEFRLWVDPKADV